MSLVELAAIHLVKTSSSVVVQQAQPALSPSPKLVMITAPSSF